jgi:hypothetical protein
MVWLVMPASAGAGFDTSHAVERTCEPGAPLVYSERYSAPGETTTVPGTVIGCPPGPLERRVQIATGPGRAGADNYFCVYWSHRNGAGRDSCWTQERPPVFALQAVARSQEGEVAVAGAADRSVRRIDLAPRELFRAARAAGPLHFTRSDGRSDFFALTVPIWDLCIAEKPRLIARDATGRVVHTQRIDRGLPLMDGPGSAGAVARECEVEIPRARSGLDALKVAGLALLLS